jgi:hypothetical protein
VLLVSSSNTVSFIISTELAKCLLAAAAGKAVPDRTYVCNPAPAAAAAAAAVQAGKRWPKFFKAIDWTQGENNVYRKWPAEFKYDYEAPKGHMPLTNALRGTQLFQAIMEHPAFAKGSNGMAGMSIDERSKLSGKDTLKF